MQLIMESEYNNINVQFINEDVKSKLIYVIDKAIQFIRNLINQIKAKAFSNKIDEVLKRYSPNNQAGRAVLNSISDLRLKVKDDLAELNKLSKQLIREKEAISSGRSESKELIVKITNDNGEKEILHFEPRELNSVLSKMHKNVNKDINDLLGRVNKLTRALTSA